MNNRIKQSYLQLAQRTGLRLDENGGGLYGVRDGYSVVVYAPNPNQPFLLTVECAAGRDGGPLTGDEIRRFKGENPAVGGLVQNGCTLRMPVKAKRKVEQTAENLEAGLSALTSFLRANGYRSCCAGCGRELPVAPRYIAGRYALLCPSCYAQIEQRNSEQQARKNQKSENIVGGIVGALLGCLIGVVCIVLISQLGYVAALSGLVMAVCALKGYELLAGKLSPVGIVLSSVLMLVMTYLGDRIDWALIAARELELSFFDGFRIIPMLLAEGGIDPSNYWGNLAMLYLFLLVGAVPTILAAMKNQKKAQQIYSLDL